jgi:hypothetical protein
MMAGEAKGGCVSGSSSVKRWGQLQVTKTQRLNAADADAGVGCPGRAAAAKCANADSTLTLKAHERGLREMVDRLKDKMFLYRTSSSPKTYQKLRKDV